MKIAFINFIFILIAVYPITAQVSQEWLNRFNGIDDSSDYGWHVIADQSGNVYSVGETYSLITKSDYCIVKYNSGGQLQWMKTFNGSANANDRAVAAAVDESGNIYVTGGARRTGTGLDICTIKFDPDGNIIWTSYYNSVADSSDEGRFIAIDRLNNIYVSGGAKGHSSDIILIKYNVSGTEQFVRTHNGSADNFDISTAMLLDDSANVVICGYVTSASSMTDYCVIKYNSSGNQMWLRTYNGPSSNFDIATGMAIDNSGNIYVNGTSTGVFNADYYTIKYDRDGNVQWGTRYNHNIAADQGSGIAVDQNGNVYAFGESMSGSTFESFDWALVKYNSNGVRQWVQRYDGTGINFDDADEVILDKAGSIYLMGASTGMNSGLDYLLLKYDQDGGILWEQTYNGSGNDFDFPASIVMDKNNIYLTGNSTGQSGNLDMLTIKYSQTTGIHILNENIPDNFSLFQNFPNPFNPSTIIRFRIPREAEGGIVKLTVFNSLGNQVATLINEKLSAGEYETEFNGANLAGGVYFYKLEAGESQMSRKMLLIK